MKKGGRSRPFESRNAIDQPRQEPGKYFGRIVVTKLLEPTAAWLPHTHWYTWVCAAGVVRVLVVGMSDRNRPSTPTPMPVVDAVTRTAPLSSVSRSFTYLEDCVDDSQPQLFALGKVAAVWNTSLMLVRQPEAARISSVTFARFV